MGYEVSVKPPKCRISTGGGTSKHTIINHCARNLAYKIVFPPGSKYSVAPDKMAGRGPTEEMVIEYFPVSANTGDASKSTYGELAGKTIVKLTPDG
ncbi:hypothetical protein TELCIR_04501 [Teladorsagia circumcincta]|uniref:MSP domain-containing protein n=1 Tax=Teladorsagia circumcincta TaxID=45464 RepID=A0A2G9UTG8_TELCI|nr:hypothetical protein TELCIR_04501 [Teladorsagia circumcincta]